MKVRAASADEIKSVVLHPEFIPLLAEDGFNGEFEPDMSEIWLLFTDLDEIIGLFNFSTVTNICMELHPMVFKKHRLQYARECMGWVLSTRSSSTFQKIGRNWSTLRRITASLRKVLTEIP